MDPRGAILAELGLSERIVSGGLANDPIRTSGRECVGVSY